MLFLKVMLLSSVSNGKSEKSLAGWPITWSVVPTG